MLYYEDYDTLSEDTRRLMQQSIAAFGGNVPTYHIALMDNHTIIWDFHSHAFGSANDVQLYADRQQKSDPPLQALHESLCRKQVERRVLQPAV